MIDASWMNDPALSSIDPNKLAFLTKLLMHGSTLTQKEMLPFLLDISRQSKENNISFSKNDIQLIYSVLIKYNKTNSDNN